MEEVYIDNEKPLWWVLLVMCCIAIIYSIGVNSGNDEHIDTMNPNMVENLNIDHR